MLETRTTDKYGFHGVGITVTCDRPAVSAALQSRLRRFPRPSPGTPGLTFELRQARDIASHLVSRSSGLARTVYDPPRGEIVYFDETDQLFIDYEGAVRLLCDPTSGQVRVSVLKSEMDNLWLISHPMFTLPLIESLKRRGLYSIHAAGLSINGRGLLIAGISGSGKSTLTLILLRAGFGFLGDDMAFLSPAPGQLRVLAFPDEIDVTDETAAFFPELVHILSSPRLPNWPKRRLLAEEFYPVDFVSQCQPGVLIFPRVADQTKSVLHPLGQDEALLELAPNVLLTDARSSQAHLDALAELVKASDCYRLESGRDFTELPKLLGGLF